MLVGEVGLRILGSYQCIFELYTDCRISSINRLFIIVCALCD